jgi:hypothetical protein
MEAKEVLVWTPELEVSLFHSMKGHKPIGKDKYNTLFPLLNL